MSASRTRVVAMLVLSLGAASSGCGFVIDGYYVVSDRTKHVTTTESRPIGQSRTQVEYTASLAPEPTRGHEVLTLACVERTRPVEAEWSVDKTYRYRGGFSRGAYLGAALISGVSALLYGGIIVGMCTSKDKPLSCDALWAMSPYAVDVPYSLTRALFAHDPKLVDRQTGDEALTFGAPTDEHDVPCDVSSVSIDHPTGPSDVEQLNGQAAETRALSADAITVPVEAGGIIDLTATGAGLARLAQSLDQALWVVGPDGVPHGIDFDRCSTLRESQAALTPEQREWFASDAQAGLDAQCPIRVPQ